MCVCIVIHVGALCCLNNLLPKTIWNKVYKTIVSCPVLGPGGSVLSTDSPVYGRANTTHLYQLWGILSVFPNSLRPNVQATQTQTSQRLKSQWLSRPKGCKICPLHIIPWGSGGQQQCRFPESLGHLWLPPKGWSSDTDEWNQTWGRDPSIVVWYPGYCPEAWPGPVWSRDMGPPPTWATTGFWCDVDWVVVQKTVGIVSPLSFVGCQLVCRAFFPSLPFFYFPKIYSVCSNNLPTRTSI